MTRALEPVPFFAGDPVFSLQTAFAKDDRTHKVNLGIGVYLDEQGQLPLMSAVKSALALDTDTSRPYIPLEGHPDTRASIQEFVLGKNHSAITSGTAATVQTIGGTGGVALIAEFLSRFANTNTVYVSDPTWDNHKGLFEKCGFRIESYPYWDPVSRSIPFDAMMASLKTAEAGSIVVLQPVCHNPTGLDLSREQKTQLTELMRVKEHIVVFDMAYQGFGSTTDEDANFVRSYSETGLPCFIVNSFSKNMSIYGERAGGLTAVCETPRLAERTLSQFQLIARQLYSCPPIGAARIVNHILGDDDLKSLWLTELASMQERIASIRQSLLTELSDLSGNHFAFVGEHKGMFSFSGFTKKEVELLKQEEGIYLLQNGRICLAGLAKKDTSHVARAFAHIVRRR